MVLICIDDIISCSSLMSAGVASLAALVAPAVLATSKTVSEPILLCLEYGVKCWLKGKVGGRVPNSCFVT